MFFVPDDHYLFLFILFSIVFHFQILNFIVEIILIVAKLPKIDHDHMKKSGLLTKDSKTIKSRLDQTGLDKNKIDQTILNHN